MNQSKALQMHVILGCQKLSRWKKSVVKGYHAYKIKPPITDPPTKLRVDRVYTNIVDRDACLVWLPEREEFDEHLLDMITDRQRHLKLSDIAGLPIGHAPRVLAGFFRTVLDEDGSVYADATGDPCQSFPPWPALGDKGGGAVIPCSYHITSSPSKFEYNLSLLNSTLEKMPEGSVMNVSFI